MRHNKTKKFDQNPWVKGKIEVSQEMEQKFNLKHKLIGRTENQKRYIKAIRENDLVIVVGPAGAGKSYIAVGLAVDMLLKEKIDKIIFIRPALEAGEKLGFMPGDSDQKLDPYMKPLFDALDKFLTFEQITKLKDQGKLEVAPVAFLRGRTFDNSFIVLDESQNLTLKQMEMATTRLGTDSKIVLTGDLSQSDLSPMDQGALELYRDYLKDIEGVGIVELTNEDIQRHKLVGKIIEVMKGKTLRDRLSVLPRKLGEY